MMAGESSGQASRRPPKLPDILFKSGRALNVNGLAFCPRKLKFMDMVSGSPTGEVSIWKHSTMPTCQTLPVQHTGAKGVHDAVSISRDESMILHSVAGHKSDVSLAAWDIASFKPLYNVKLLRSKIDGRAFCTFSPDSSKLLACVTIRSVSYVFDLSDLPREISKWKSFLSPDPIPSKTLATSRVSSSHWPNAQAFSADNKYIIIGSGKATRIWNAETGTADLWIVNEAPPSCVAMSNSGSFLFAEAGPGVGDNPRNIMVYSTVTQKRQNTLVGLRRNISAAAFSANGKIVAGGTVSGSLKLWDVRQEREVAKLSSHGGCIKSIVFGGNHGNALATSADDSVVRLWDLRDLRRSLRDDEKASSGSAATSGGGIPEGAGEGSTMPTLPSYTKAMAPSSHSHLQQDSYHDDLDEFPPTPSPTSPGEGPSFDYLLPRITALSPFDDEHDAAAPPRAHHISATPSIPRQDPEKLTLHLPRAPSTPTREPSDFSGTESDVSSIVGDDLRSTLSRLPGVLSSGSQILDVTAYVRKIEEFPIGAGGFGDVYKGGWVNLPDDVEVPGADVLAIKVMRQFSDPQWSSESTIKNLRREVAVWQKLSHENILQFVGLSYGFGRLPSLVSCWMENGTARSYLKKYPETPRPPMVAGVARGLNYLHTFKPRITHGDLKAENVLVDGRGNVRLNDFGLSRMLTDEALWLTTATSAPGSVRWMAPELLDGSERVVNWKTDVYAFALTALEILTGDLPFSKHRSDGAVVAALGRGEHPDRPALIKDSVWTLLSECWSTDPDDRPSMRVVTLILDQKSR